MVVALAAMAMTSNDGLQNSGLAPAQGCHYIERATDDRRGTSTTNASARARIDTELSSKSAARPAKG